MKAAQACRSLSSSRSLTIRETLLFRLPCSLITTFTATLRTVVRHCVIVYHVLAATYNHSLCSVKNILNRPTESMLQLSQQSPEDIKMAKTIEDARRDIAKQGKEQLERSAKRQAEDEADAQADDLTSDKALQEARRDVARQGRENRAKKHTGAQDVSKSAAVVSNRPLTEGRATSPPKVLANNENHLGL